MVTVIKLYELLLRVIKESNLINIELTNIEPVDHTCSVIFKSVKNPEGSFKTYVYLHSLINDQLLLQMITNKISVCSYLYFMSCPDLTLKM